VCLAILVAARRGPVPVGLALGLAVITKGTGYVFAAPFLAWWAIESSGRRQDGSPTGSPSAMTRGCARALGSLGVALILAGAINAGHYARNLAWYGAPLGPGRDGPYQYTNEHHGPLAVLSVAVRNLAVHAATPWPPVNERATSAIERLHRRAGLDA